jgi:hypothetical protein
MRLFFLFFISFLLNLFILSCSDEQAVNPPKFTGTLANFSDIQAKVFSSCASNDCHSTGSKKGNLDLTESVSYSSLYNRPSSIYPQFKRVHPGKPNESVLMMFLRGDVSPQMPQNGSLPFDTIDSIESWIAKGALRN